MQHPRLDPPPHGRTGIMAVDALTVALEDTDIPVLRDIDLHIAPGQFVGLAGETGSGKTTLGLALMGFLRSGLRHANGAVCFGDTDMMTPDWRDMRAHRGHMVAYVPQDPTTALNPGMRIEDIFNELFRAHGFRDRAANLERIATLFDAMQLSADHKVLRRFPHQFSGGQLQRIAIALGFALRPRIVVMDEPTTGLDAMAKMQVVELVRQLSRTEGSSILFISHDMRLLLGSADRIVIMYAGEIVEDAPARQIASAPRHPYTRALIDALPDPRGERPLMSLPGIAPALAERSQGCVFAPRCAHADARCRETTPELDRPEPEVFVRCLRHADLPPRDADTTEAPERRRVEHARTGLVTLEGVRTYYSDYVVTERIDLSVAASECIAIVGESGSGKTTLVRAVAGLHTEYDGRIKLDGKALPRSVNHRDLETLAAIQYVFQNPYASLNPRRKVGETIALAAQSIRRLSRAEARSEAAAAAHSMALRDEIFDAYPFQLSGGERQRVALARALVTNPRVLICDEVTSSLDISVQAGIVNQLKVLQQERGMALLFITHDLALASVIANWALVLKSGEVVESGPSHALFAHPTHNYTKMLISSSMATDRVDAG